MKDAVINIEGVIGEEYTVQKLVSDVALNKDADSYTFVIDSVGGLVDDGFAMAAYIESIKKPTTTIAKKVYSIANVLFFAGKNRQVAEGGEFMLHMAWASVQGNANDLRLYSEFLDKEDRRINAYIAERTGLDSDAVKALMNKDTYISAQEATELGFLNVIERPRMAAMTIKSDTYMNKIEKYFASIAEKLGIKAEGDMPEAKNMELELEDGTMIFVESEDGELIGKLTDAPAGTHMLRDGRSITVVESEQGNVVESVQEASAQALDIEALKAENAAMKAEIEAMKKEKDAYAKEVEQKLAFILKNMKSDHKPVGKQPVFGDDANNNAAASFAPKQSAAQKLMNKISESKK